MPPIGSDHKPKNRRVENCPLLGIDLRAQDGKPTATTARLFLAIKDGNSKLFLSIYKVFNTVDISFH